MTLTRRESEERQQAVLRFFIESGLSPDGTKTRATGDEAQRALTTGRLTGKKDQPPMGLNMLYRLQRQAVDHLKKGKPLPPAPVPPPAHPVPYAPAPVIEALRSRTKELEAILNNGSSDVVEIHITRDGVRIVRMQPTEEKL